MQLQLVDERLNATMLIDNEGQRQHQGKDSLSNDASSLLELRVCSSRLLLRASMAAMSSRMCRSFMSSVASDSCA